MITHSSYEYLIFNGDAFKGATAETASSGGTKSRSIRSADNTGIIVQEVGAIILEKGSTLSIDYTPPTSNTSQIVQFSVEAFFQDIVV